MGLLSFLSNKTLQSGEGRRRRRRRTEENEARLVEEAVQIEGKTNEEQGKRTDGN